MKSIKHFYYILDRKEKSQAFQVLVLVFGMAILDTLNVFSIMPFLAVLSNPEIVNESAYLNFLFIFSKNFGVSDEKSFLFFLGSVIFIITTFAGIYRSITLYLTTLFIEMRRHSISERLLSTYFFQPYEFYLQRNTTDLSKMVLSEVDRVVSQIFRPVINMITYSLVAIIIMVLLIMINPILTLLAISILGGLYIIFFLGLKNRLKKQGEKTVFANKKRFSIVGEGFGGIKYVKMLNCENTFLDDFKEHSHQFSNSVAVHHTLNQIPKYLIEIFAFGGLILVAMYFSMIESGKSGSSLSNILPLLGLYAFAAYRLQPAMQAIFQGFASLKYGKSALDNIFLDLQKKHELSHQSDEFLDSVIFNKNIEINNLTYTYDGTQTPVLKNINIIIPYCSSLGIIGATGSGKTTLVDVLLGLLEPTNGTISVDGVKINSSNRNNWQKKIGYVPQEIFLLDNTIVSNIAFGETANKINFEKVKHCAYMAQIGEFIEKDLPMGYQTYVGERGVRLSGGQRQRIGIARALYREPELIIFDEATSALDSSTEKEVMDSIDSLFGQKSIIVIAHRVSTLSKCDRIIRLKNGKTIVEK